MREYITLEYQKLDILIMFFFSNVRSKEHHDNMEAMSKKVIRCLSTARFNNFNIHCERGDYASIYNDEAQLRKFLSLSEENKSTCGWSYSVENNNLAKELTATWNADTKERFYFDDYKIINNMGVVDTAWKRSILNAHSKSWPSSTATAFA